jgi:5-formyltetrahydrofolate cyclo-ligase
VQTSAGKKEELYIIVSEKERIRRRILALRSSLGKREIARKSAQIKDALFNLEEFKKARSVSFYLSMESEVQTGEMIREAAAGGKRVVVPYIDPQSRELTLSELKSPDEELVPGPYAVMQPREEHLRPVTVAQVELMVVPGLAFDVRGNRLGFGKGYYDRLLSHKGEATVCIGLAFQFQMMDEVPAGRHDVPMDIIVTEKMVVMAHHGGRRR